MKKPHHKIQPTVQRPRDISPKAEPTQGGNIFASLSERDLWWKSTIKDTPIPGTYEATNFIEELLNRQMTYGFKSPGRTYQPYISGKGDWLLPGAYHHSGLADRLNATNQTYSFKSTKRQPDDILRFGLHKDTKINVSPDKYNTEKYFGIGSYNSKMRRHWFFKSGSKRLPTSHFQPKEGPGPANYTNDITLPKCSITSVFKSRTPRFVSSHTKVPGPGTYDKTEHNSKVSKPVQEMGQYHGIFFPGTFN